MFYWIRKLFALEFLIKIFIDKGGYNLQHGYVEHFSVLIVEYPLEEWLWRENNGNYVGVTIIIRKRVYSTHCRFYCDLPYFLYILSRYYLSHELTIIIIYIVVNWKATAKSVSERGTQFRLDLCVSIGDIRMLPMCLRLLFFSNWRSETIRNYLELYASKKT